MNEQITNRNKNTKKNDASDEMELEELTSMDYDIATGANKQWLSPSNDANNTFKGTKIIRYQIRKQEQVAANQRQDSFINIRKNASILVDKPI